MPEPNLPTAPANPPPTPRPRRFWLTLSLCVAAGIILLAVAVFCLTHLKPSPLPPPNPPACVVVDAGHGGEQSGAVFDSREEKTDTLRLTLLVQDKLQERGIRVILTRKDDQTLSLRERCDIVNAAGADLCVSIHRNQGGGAGVETYIAAVPDDISAYFAAKIQKNLLGTADWADRRVRRGTADDPAKDLAMNGSTDIPSCLVEVGFLDNPEDNRRFDDNFDAIARAIADGILGESP